MSIPTLTPSYVFGLNASVQGNAFFLDEATVSYPVGHEMVQYNFEKKTQKIQHLQLDGDDIFSMAVNMAENLLLVGSRSSSSERTACVHVYDVSTGKRKKVYKPNDIVQEFISVSFSGDGKYVLAQAGGPEWSLYVWTAEKAKLISYGKSSSGHLEVRKMSSNHFDLTSTQVVVSGENFFRLFKFQDGGLKIIHQMKLETEIRTHTWINETKMACGTTDSKILILDNGELLSEFQYIPVADDMKEDLSVIPTFPTITALASFSGGLFIGLSTGYLLYYEKCDEAPFYKKKREDLLEESEVNCISWNFREDKAVVTMKSNQIYLVQIETDQKGEHVKIERLSHSFHTGAISSMDVCISKPLLVTSGEDMSIRIWNYVDNCLEVVNFYNEAAACVSIHPNGLYILAGFPSGLKLMAILLGEIKPYWENTIRSARDCKFSNGGQFFAVLTSVNVMVFNTYTVEPLGLLKVSATRIKGFAWSEDDTQVMTFCQDGSIQYWSAFGFLKTNENKVSCPGAEIISGALLPSATTNYVLTSNSTIFEVINGSVTRELHSQSGLAHLILSPSGQMQFTATKTGIVHTTKFPYSIDGPMTEEFLEYNYSDHPINHMVLSFNGRFLFTAGLDGALWIHKVNDKEGRLLKKEKDWEYSDEILVQRSDLKENWKYLTNLKLKVDDMKVAGDNAMRNKDIYHDSKLNELSAQHNKELAAVQTIIDTLQEECAKISGENSEQHEKSKAANLIELNEINEAFYNKIELEKLRYTALLERRAALEEQWQAKMNNIESNHEINTVEITAFFNKQMEEKNAKIVRLKKESAQADVKHESYIRDIEGDIDKEAHEIEFFFETKLKDERTLLKSVKEENDVMKSTFVQLQHQIEQHKKDLSISAHDAKVLGSTIKALENDIVGLHGEIKEREDTIADKEKRIFDLKKKNSELEKFKFVLDFKIIELVKQEEPREQDIIALNHTLKLMGDELLEFYQKQTKLERQHDELLMKSAGSQLQFTSEKWRLQKLQLTIAGIKEEILKSLSLITNKKVMTRVCTALFHKFKELEEQPPIVPTEALKKHTQQIEEVSDSKNDQKSKRSVNPDIRIREQLEITVRMLKIENVKGQGKRNQVSKKFIEEGLLLTQELNALRKDFHGKRIRIKDMEKHLQESTPFRDFIKEELERPKPNELDFQAKVMTSTIMPLPPILPPLKK